MVRSTRKDADRAVEFLANQIGVPHTKCHVNVKGKIKSIVGCLSADCNSTLGGCKLEEIVNEGGAVSSPLGDVRLKTGDFVQSIRQTTRGLERYCKIIKKR